MKLEKAEKRVRAWATVDVDDGSITGVYATREKAREEKRHAERYGWNQKVAKLSFDSWVR